MSKKIEFGIPQSFSIQRFLFLLLKMICFFSLSGLGVSMVAVLDGEGKSPLLPIQQPAGPYMGQPLPGDRPVLFAPGIVSTRREHSAAMFTPDGKEIWLGRIFPSEIVFFRRENGHWSGPTAASFSGEFNDLYPFLSADGNKLIYTSTRPREMGEAPLSRGRGHLWMVERTAAGWSQPVHLGEKVNFGPMQGSPCVSGLGNLYYSARNTQDPSRSSDLYCSRWEEGGFAEPENLGPVINSPAPEHCPFVAPDESYLIYSSFRGGFGRSDLFISFRRPGGSWTEPKNLGKKINSTAKDEYPYMTPDGQFFFFNSSRISELNSKPVPDGPGNVYWMDAGFIDKFKIEALREDDVKENEASRN